MSDSKTITFYDLETTGLDAQRNAVIQFGAVMVTSDKLEVIGEHFFNVLPFSTAVIDPEACKINGYTPEGWAEALGPLEACRRIAKALRGTQLAGHNIKRFDNLFIRSMYDRFGGRFFYDYSPLDNPVIDTKELAKNLGYSAKQSSLWNLALAFDLVKPTDNRGAHNALVDAKLSLGIYRELIKLSAFSPPNEPKTQKTYHL